MSRRCFRAHKSRLSDNSPVLYVLFGDKVTERGGLKRGRTGRQNDSAGFSALEPLVEHACLDLVKAALEIGQRFAVQIGVHLREFAERGQGQFAASVIGGAIAKKLLRHSKAFRFGGAANRLVFSRSRSRFGHYGFGCVIGHFVAPRYAPILDASFDLHTALAAYLLYRQCSPIIPEQFSHRCRLQWAQDQLYRPRSELVRIRRYRTITKSLSDTYSCARYSDQSPTGHGSCLNPPTHRVDGCGQRYSAPVHVCEV